MIVNILAESMVKGPDSVFITNVREKEPFFGKKSQGHMWEF